MARTPDQKAEAAAETLLKAASQDVAREAARWLTHLSAERHLAELTREAYARDVAAFLAFLADHLGGRPNLAALSKLAPADIRAFLASRRKGRSATNSRSGSTSPRSSSISIA